REWTTAVEARSESVCGGSSNGRLARPRQSTESDYCISRDERSRGYESPPVSLSASRNVQGHRQHERCGEFCLQRTVGRNPLTPNRAALSPIRFSRWAC